MRRAHSAWNRSSASSMRERPVPQHSRGLGHPEPAAERARGEELHARRSSRPGSISPVRPKRARHPPGEAPPGRSRSRRSRGARPGRRVSRSSSRHMAAPLAASVVRGELVVEGLHRARRGESFSTTWVAKVGRAVAGRCRPPPPGPPRCRARAAAPPHSPGRLVLGVDAARVGQVLLAVGARRAVEDVVGGDGHQPGARARGRPGPPAAVPPTLAAPGQAGLPLAAVHVGDRAGVEHRLARRKSSSAASTERPSPRSASTPAVACPRRAAGRGRSPRASTSCRPASWATASPPSMPLAPVTATFTAGPRTASRST